MDDLDCKIVITGRPFATLFGLEGKLILHFGVLLNSAILYEIIANYSVKFKRKASCLPVENTKIIFRCQLIRVNKGHDDV